MSITHPSRFTLKCKITLIQRRAIEKKMDKFDERCRCIVFNEGRALDFVDCSRYINYFISFPLSAGHVWLGLTDMDVEGIWRWYSNNNIAKFTDWYPGEPAGNGGEDCVVMVEPSNEWQDYPCSRSYHPLCERKYVNQKYDNIPIFRPYLKQITT